MFKPPNKIIFNQDRKKQWKIHQQKLQNVKCSVDHHLNATVSMIRFKPHNIFQQLEIQKQNEIHVKNILNIQASSQLRSLNSNSSISTNFQNKTNIQSISGGGSITAQNKTPSLGTLHKGFFKKQKRQMDEENQTFFRRIQDTKSYFNVLKWQQEAEERKKILLVRSEFPQSYKLNQNGNHTYNTINKSQDQTAFNNSINNQSIDINKSLNSNKNSNVKNNNYFNANSNNKNTSQVLKDSSQIEINNQSQQHLNTNDNNESININDQGQITGLNENDKKERNKFLTINNLAIPTDFYFSLNSNIINNQNTIKQLP